MSSYKNLSVQLYLDGRDVFQVESKQEKTFFQFRVKLFIKKDLGEAAEVELNLTESAFDALAASMHHAFTDYQIATNPHIAAAMGVDEAERWAEGDLTKVSPF